MELFSIRIQRTFQLVSTVWIPFTSTDLPNDTWSDQHMGMMSVTIFGSLS